MTSKLLSYGTQLCKSEELISKACSSIDEKEGDFNHLSNFIWEHPELGYMEIEAHKILTGYLEKEGFNVSKNFVVETGFRAQYVHSDGPNIAVFCEYDALPSIGHACGHNLIAVAGIAAAVGIKDALQKSKIKGKITVYGTPAEEGLGGKIDFIEENAFQNIDAALMVHPCSFNAVKPGILTRMNADVTFTGQGSHAGGAPWEGVNAMDAAVLAYQGISTMRQQIRTDCRFHVLISHSEDAKLNIIPSKAYMKVGTRAPDLVALGTMKHKLVSILEGAALMTGCSLAADLHTQKLYKNMFHNAVLCELYQFNAESLGISFEREDEGKILGSSDMGNVSRHVPSIHPVYNIHTSAANHTEEFTAAAGSATAFKATMVQAKALAMTALDLISNPEILEKVNGAFREDVIREKALTKNTHIGTPTTHKKYKESHTSSRSPPRSPPRSPTRRLSEER